MPTTVPLLIVVVPPAFEPMFTSVVDPEALPVPKLTVLVIPEPAAPVLMLVVLAAVLS